MAVEIFVGVKAGVPKSDSSQSMHVMPPSISSDNFLEYGSEQEIVIIDVE